MAKTDEKTEELKAADAATENAALEVKPEGADPAAVEGDDIIQTGDEDDFDPEVAEAVVRSLVKIEKAAREQGHTLTQVLAKAAKDAFGIDVRA